MGTAIRVTIEADGTQWVFLEGDNQQPDLLATEPAWLSVKDGGNWACRLALELRHRASLLEIAAATIARESQILPLVVDDRRPVHTCALPPQRPTHAHHQPT
jgi:hypothetical protein